MDLEIPEPTGPACSLSSIELWWPTILLISIAPTITWEHWDTEGYNGVEGRVTLLHGIFQGSQKEADQSPAQRCLSPGRERRKENSELRPNFKSEMK